MAIEGVFVSAYYEKFGSKELDIAAAKKKVETIKVEVEKVIVDVKKQREDVDSLTLSDETKNFLDGEASFERFEEYKKYSIDFYSKYKNHQQELEKKYKKFEEDPFWSDTGNQWLVISEALYNKGFYDNMSKEEVEEVEIILEKITDGMDSVSGHYGTGKFSACHSGISKNNLKPFMSSSEAYLELESATAALRVFGEKYIAEEDREEFNQLVDQFHLHNSYILEDYESPEESFNRGIHSIYTSEIPENSPINRAIANQNKEGLKISIYLGGINHTKEDKELFKKNLAELFKNLQSDNMANEDIWKDIEKMFLDFATDNGKKYIRDYVSEKSGYIFEHMKSYWSELAAM